MDTHEHAQLIYAHLLSGWLASGRNVPPPSDDGLIQEAWRLAKQFEKVSEAK